MNKKRNLPKELNIKNCINTTSSAFDINIDKIKRMVESRIDSVVKERKHKIIIASKEN